MYQEKVSKVVAINFVEMVSQDTNSMEVKFQFQN